jgi:hypothetical protein
MRRPRRFCPYCGCIIDGRNDTCWQHRDLPWLDGTELIGIESTPMQDEKAAPSGEDSPAAREKGA